jgi:hypothetical protein
MNPPEVSFTKRAYQNVVEKKGTLATIATIVAIVASIVGTYISLSNNLTIAKAARDEQMKGYAVQIGVLRSEVDGLQEELKDNITRLTNWNKSLTERLNNQEKAFRQQESNSLQDRINRLEDAAMKRRR